VYTITIPHNKEGVPALVLKTEARKLCKPVAELAKENGLEVKVTEEREPRVVKIKGL